MRYESASQENGQTIRQAAIFSASACTTLRYTSFTGHDTLSPFYKGGINAYAYCGVYPINRIDPTGHNWNKQIRSFLSQSNQLTDDLKANPRLRLCYAGFSDEAVFNSSQELDVKKGYNFSYARAYKKL